MLHDFPQNYSIVVLERKFLKHFPYIVLHVYVGLRTPIWTIFLVWGITGLTKFAQRSWFQQFRIFTFYLFLPSGSREKVKHVKKKKKTDNLRDEQTVEQPDNRRQVIRKTHLNHRFR